MIELSWYITVFLAGMLIGVIIGMFRMASHFRKKYYLVLRKKERLSETKKRKEKN